MNVPVWFSTLVLSNWKLLLLWAGWANLTGLGLLPSIVSFMALRYVVEKYVVIRGWDYIRSRL